MAEIRFSHELECDEETYWERCLFNADYNRRLFLEELKFLRFELLELSDLGDRIVKRVEADPPLGALPGPVKRALGDRFAYREEGTYERATRSYEFKVTPSTFAEKTKLGGVLFTEKIDDKRCRRVAVANVEVKVFGIGGFVEDKILADLRASYDASALFTNAYVKEMGY